MHRANFFSHLTAAKLQYATGLQLTKSLQVTGNPMAYAKVSKDLAPEFLSNEVFAMKQLNIYIVNKLNV